MRHCKCILAVLLVALLLTGCTDALFTTAEYRAYQSFAEKHNAGMEKQEILDQLGCPDGYVDAQGNYQSIEPADPYRLKITFDADGNSESAELTLVPGG